MPPTRGEGHGELRRSAPTSRRAAASGRRAAPVNEARELRKFDEVNRLLGRHGLLPFSDAEVPSVVSVVAGDAVAGSWWGHPAGRLIYSVGERLDHDPAIVVVKLWKGKQTLVHRRLWPALLRIGAARSPWQVAGLSPEASRLLDHLDRVDRVRGDRLPPDFESPAQGLAHGLRVLESRLLVLTRSVHTSSGAHALEAESWRAWGTRSRTRPYRGTALAAQVAMEKAAHSLSTELVSPLPLPWNRPRSRSGGVRRRSPVRTPSPPE